MRIVLNAFVLIFMGTLSYGQDQQIKVDTDDIVEASEIKAQANEVKAIKPPTASKNSSAEKITVTGSRIKRIDVEGPSPVLTLDREYLDQSGYNSVADVLRDTTVSSFGVQREFSDQVANVGAATIGLRGLGADRTLVLLDGNRLPKVDGGNSVDLNLIPFEAIERVEILKDGASAIYGSDALAGVINFILKKDYDGTTFKTRYSQPDEPGGVRQEIAASYGKTFSKGSVLAVYQYRNNERINDRDRPWSRGGESTFSSPPNYRLNDKTSKWTAHSSCPPERTRNDPDGSSYCTFDYSQYTSSLPDTEQHSAMVRGDYKLAGPTKAFATTTYSHRQVRWQWAPSATDFSDTSDLTKNPADDFTIPGKAFSGKPGFKNIDPNARYNMRYRTVTELGPRVSRDTTDSYGAVVGVQGEMGETWDWTTSMNYGATELVNLRHGGYGNQVEALSQIIEGKLIPGNELSARTVGRSIHHTGRQAVTSNVSTAQFVTSGEMFNVGSSVWSMATGASGTWEDYRIDTDPVSEAGNLLGGGVEVGQGDRNYQSVFSELGVNAGPLEVLLAGRFDNYSDFGSTVNPKLAVRVAATRSVMFRASAGTGFRAPALDELYSGVSEEYPWIQDTLGCATNGGRLCDSQQYRVRTSGNTNLKEETSFSYNVGSVIQATSNLSLSADYWGTEVKNAVGMNLQDLMVAEQRLGNQTLRAQGIEINRSNGEIDEIFAPSLNLAAQKVQGLEFGAGYTIKSGSWTFRPRIDHSQLLEMQEEIFPGLGFVDKLGEAGMPEWRNNVSLGVNRRNHGGRLMARTIAGQFKQRHLADPTFQGRLPTYTEYDVHYAYNAYWGGEVSVGVKNLLGSDRPLDDTASFDQRLNAQLYDQIGRLVYLGYRQVF